MKYRLYPFVIISMLLFAHSLQAQHQPLTWGLSLGVNLSDAEEEVSYISENKKAKLGFQIGFNTAYHFTNSVYMQSGLSLTTKGTRHQQAEMWVGASNPPVTYHSTTTNQVYLQMPFRLGYRMDIASNYRLFLNAGAYIAYGIGGKETIKSKTVNASSNIPDEKRTSNTFGEERTSFLSTNGLAREDYGLSFGIGTAYKKISLSIDYELGLPNIGEIKDDTSFDERIYKNKNLSLTIGYNF